MPVHKESRCKRTSWHKCSAGNQDTGGRGAHIAAHDSSCDTKKHHHNHRHLKQLQYQSPDQLQWELTAFHSSTRPFPARGCMRQPGITATVNNVVGAMVEGLQLGGHGRMDTNAVCAKDRGKTRAASHNTGIRPPYQSEGHPEETAGSAKTMLLPVNEVSAAQQPRLQRTGMAQHSICCSTVRSMSHNNLTGHEGI